MDFNEYTLMLLLQDRQTEMLAEAWRDAWLREATRPRRPFRAALGGALIRLGAWLLGQNTRPRPGGEPRGYRSSQQLRPRHEAGKDPSGRGWSD